MSLLLFTRPAFQYAINPKTRYEEEIKNIERSNNKASFTGLYGPSPQRHIVSVLRHILLRSLHTRKPSCTYMDPSLPPGRRPLAAAAAAVEQPCAQIRGISQFFSTRRIFENIKRHRLLCYDRIRQFQFTRPPHRLVAFNDQLFFRISNDSHLKNRRVYRIIVYYVSSPCVRTTGSLMRDKITV